jgi:hypothetical protein
MQINAPDHRVYKLAKNEESRRAMSDTLEERRRR